MFFAVLKLFLNEIAFYAKLSGRFLEPKAEIKRPIASKFGANKHLNSLKPLSKFHEARPNRSRVTSKSLKLRNI